MNYELKTEQFSGPIEKLWELIEEKKLEITELNLAEVTADFLNYLKTIEKVEPKLLADFVVIASRLLLIQSKALLPNLELTVEEEKDIKDLEARLRFYRNFKPAMNLLGELWERKQVSFSRPFMAGRPPVFYPAYNINIEELSRVLGVLFEALRQLTPEAQIAKSSLVSLEEKIQEIISRMEKSAAFKFDSLTKEKGRSEIIVFFLAILHLLERQLIKVEQKKGFSDIMIEGFVQKSEPKGE